MKKSWVYDLCITDFSKKCALVLRKIQPPKIGAKNLTEVMQTLFTSFFYVSTIQGSTRYNGVTINKEATHLYVTRYSKTYPLFDGSGEWFIYLNGRYFKVLTVTNIDEKNDFLVFQCTERGLESKEASHA